MATNIRVFGASPRLPVDACVGAHVSGELCYENGKVGIAVEANQAGAPNTLIQRAKVVYPVPAGTAAGTKLYMTGVPVAGGTIQAPPVRSVNVASTLTATATGNTLIGTTMDAAVANNFGASTCANIEIAPQ